MPTLKHRLPKYRLHKKSGQAIVTLNGHDIYLGKYKSASSKRKYEQVTGEWQSNGRKLPLAKEQPVSISELCVSYVQKCRQHYQKNGKATSEYGAAKSVIRFFREQYGNTNASEFGPICFKAFRQRYIDRGLVRTTINHYMIHVLGVFQLALENEQVSFEVYHRLKCVKRLQKNRSQAKESTKRRAVELTRVEATLPFLSKVVADMVRLQMLTGMRPNEVCQMRPMDVNRESDVWVYIPNSHKTEHHDHERLVHIGPEGQAVLRPYLLRKSDVNCFSPAESAQQMRDRRTLARKTPETSGNRVGSKKKKRKPKRAPKEQFSTTSYGRAISRASAKAFPAHEQTKKDETALKEWNKTNRWSPNQLRKLTATTIRQHCGLEQAQIILGHSNRSTTEKWYAEPYNESAADVMRKFG